MSNRNTAGNRQRLPPGELLLSMGTFWNVSGAEQPAWQTGALRETLVTQHRKRAIRSNLVQAAGKRNSGIDPVFAI